MKLTQILLLLLCTVGISVGQILFKVGAQRLAGLSPTDFVARVLFNPFVVSALVVYASATLLWIWILREVPLIRAYPFMAAAFVLVPLASWLLFGESLSSPTVVGLLLVIIGLLLVSF